MKASSEEIYGKLNARNIMKSRPTFSGLKRCRWQHWSICIHSAVIASKIWDILRKRKIRIDSSSRLSKVIDIGVKTFDAPNGGTPCDINVIYNRWKVHLIGYKSVVGNMGLSSFV